MLLRVQISRELQLGLEAPEGKLLGFERAALDTEHGLRPEMWGEVLHRFQGEVLDHVCGPKGSPLPRGRKAPFRCPACGRDRGFRRRGSRSRPRKLLTRLGPLELHLAQVGCRCGRRFAPLLQLMGVEPGARLGPGLARRAAELATDIPFVKVADQLREEIGISPSVRTVRRLVKKAGERCDLTKPRRLKNIPAMLLDGTRVPAARTPRRRHRDERGVELNIACGVMGRDLAGRRPKAKLEILGASVGERWSALEPAVASADRAGIAVTDGSIEILNLLKRAAPSVPHQHCTFHVIRDVKHRLWQDGVAFKDRGEVADRLVQPILDASSKAASQRALVEALDFAEGHGWSKTAFHLRRIGPQLSVWHSVRRSNRGWRMPGRARPEHTTSVLERAMREINRRVDPPGNRWTVSGMRSMVNLLLGRRFEHPAWVRLWQDYGNVGTWAGLR